jgi:hypothetical protein
MSVEVVPDLSSPSSSSYDSNDLNALSLSLTKEQLRETALSRLTELRTILAEARSQITALQHDKGNSQSQVEELRQLIKMMRERIEEESQYNSSTTEIQPTQQSSARVQQPSVNIQSIAGSVQIKTVLPEKFNGVDKTPTITNWLYSMKKHLRVTKTSEEDYIEIATSFFSGTALEWWSGNERTEGEAIYLMSWSEFEARCLGRFQAVNDIQLAFQRLLRWRQTGSTASYVAGFQTVVQRIPLEIMSEHMRIMFFTEGLNQELQRSVKLMKPKTLDEAINVAQTASAIDQYGGQSTQSINRQPSRQVSTVVRSTSRINRASSGSRFAPLSVENIEDEGQPIVEDTYSLRNEGENTLSELECSYLNSEQKKLLKEGRCFKCKRFGHLAKDCRSAISSTKEQARV